MKTFSSWWFSWYAAGRAENATTNSGTSNIVSGGDEEVATATVAVMTATASATAMATATKTAKVTAGGGGDGGGGCWNPTRWVRTYEPLPQVPTRQSVPTTRKHLPGYFGLPIGIPTLSSITRPAILKGRSP